MKGAGRPRLSPAAMSVLEQAMRLFQAPAQGLVKVRHRSEVGSANGGRNRGMTVARAKRAAAKARNRRRGR